MNNYLITTRRVSKGGFQNEPGEALFIKAPAGRDYVPSDAVRTRGIPSWFSEIRDLADGQADQRVDHRGDVLFFVHGYNNTITSVRERQEALQADLTAEGWKGIVVGFDWPSSDSALNYLEDRDDAAGVARALVTAGVRPLIDGRKRGCETNVHLLGHSTGAYVIMTAFAEAEKKGDFYKDDWRVGQVAFIAGDVSHSSLDAADQWAKPMFDRIMRLTNYQNGYDNILAVSNAKRLGVSPRAGRVGLSGQAHPKAVNVDCSEYYSTLDPHTQGTKIGTWCHSWHIGNRVFSRDLAMAMEGRIDRHHIPTRKLEGGRLLLQDRPRPPHEQAWLDLMNGR